MAQLTFIDDEAAREIERANEAAERGGRRKPRAKIPATQVATLFRTKMNIEVSTLNARITEGATQRAKLETKRDRYRPDVLAKEAAEIRRVTGEKVDAIMNDVRTLEADAQAQLDGPYADIDTLRRGQRFAADAVANAQLGSALREELRHTGVRGLLDRAERANADGDVPTAVAIEDEIERRAGSSTPIDIPSRDEVLKLVRTTENPALRADLIARSILVETTQTAEEARFIVRSFEEKTHGGRERIHLALRRDEGV